MKKTNFLAAFTLGFFLGLAVMNLFHIHSIDRLHRIQKQLTNQLLDRDIKLEKLSENIKSNNNLVIKDLKISVDFDGNVMVKDAIENNIRFYLSDLVGKSVDDIDGDMIYKIFNNRIIEIEDKKINIAMKYLIIKEMIHISVEGRLVD